MSEIYFTFQQQPQIKRKQEDLLDLYNAIINDTDTTTETEVDTLAYPQFYTLCLDSLLAIKNTPIVEMQKNLLSKKLNEFARQAKQFLTTEENPNAHYYNFKIPKASGGLRLINAPDEELKKFLKDIKDFLQNTLHVLPHNAAHAYVPNRSAITALQRHQHNKSKWFGKLDLTNFFPSCTEEFIHQQLQKIFPFCLMYSTKRDRTAMDVLVRVACFRYEKNYGLPQGTPLSPFLTNILMIPIDYEIHNLCRQWHKQHFVYTRYADDMLISSEYDFDCKALENEIKAIINKHAPFNINSDKTRYGSITGRNWNLGLMLNASNEITIGYRRKRDIKQKLLNFCQHYEDWTLEDMQSFHGELAYFLHIEPEYAQYIINEYSTKYNGGTNILEQMRANF